MKLRRAAIILAGLVGCGGTTSPFQDAAGGGEGVTHVTGSFGGSSLAGLDHALSEVVTTNNGSSLEVVLAATATCGDVTGGPSANAAFVVLTLFATDTSGTGPYVSANVVTFDASCTPVPATTGQFTAGTVALTSINGDTAVGTFDLTDGSDHASGMFETASCTGAGELPFPAQTTSCH